MGLSVGEVAGTQLVVYKYNSLTAVGPSVSIGNWSSFADDHGSAKKNSGI